LTLPESDTFVPEFGIHLPAELIFNFDNGSPTPGARDELEYNLNLSDALQTPLHGFNAHEFSLPGYNAYAAHVSTDDGFGDFSGGFDDDDILRNADDVEALDFDLEPTPTHPSKRLTENVDGSSVKHTRYTSADGTDDEVQRIAREDHEPGQQPHLDDFGTDAGFDNPSFDEYHTPPPQESVQGTEDQEIAQVKKRRRIVIVEDDATMIADADFRSWPAKYREMQEAATTRRKNLEMNRIAKKNAIHCVWGWGGDHMGGLPPMLNQLFSRDALLQRWTGESQTAVVPGKRKRDDEDGEVEYGMGMEDAGGFDPIDYGVCAWMM
jgi:hypothetical protein